MEILTQIYILSKFYLRNNGKKITVVKMLKMIWFQEQNQGKICNECWFPWSQKISCCCR